MKLHFLNIRCRIYKDAIVKIYKFIVNKFISSLQSTYLFMFDDVRSEAGEREKQKIKMKREREDRWERRERTIKNIIKMHNRT
jgi:hypothetical protein